MSQFHRENPDAPIKHEWFEGARQHAGVDPASGKDFSAVQNTDRELWRETSGDFYADSIHVTLDGNIGIQVGGSVLVMPLKRWFEAGMTPMPEKPKQLADQNTCLHENFACECDVNRLSKTEGGPINRFTMDVRVKCADCGLSFRFIGLPAGLDLNGAATSIDACEGRFAIAPKGQVISVLEGEPTGFSVRNEGPTESDKIDILTDRLADFVDNAIRKGSCATYADWQAQIHALLASRR